MKRRAWMIYVGLACAMFSGLAYVVRPQAMTDTISWIAGIFRAEKAQTSESDPHALTPSRTSLPSDPSKPDESKRTGGAPVAAPESVTFDVLFNLVVDLDNQADRLESQGKNGKIWRDYLINRIGLSAREVALVKTTAKKFASELAPLNSRVQEIVTERRKDAQQPREPNPELASLQQKREDITIKYRDMLDSKLSAESSQRIRQFLQEKFSHGGLQLLDEETLKHLKERSDNGASERGLNLSNLPGGGK